MWKDEAMSRVAARRDMPATVPATVAAAEAAREGKAGDAAAAPSVPQQDQPGTGVQACERRGSERHARCGDPHPLATTRDAIDAANVQAEGDCFPAEPVWPGAPFLHPAGAPITTWSGPGRARSNSG